MGAIELMRQPQCPTLFPTRRSSDLVTQAQVNPRVGFSFATGLRSILRQDPDIILVGEIRDAETADISDRKSTRLNSSHSQISYDVFCLKKRKGSVMHGCESGIQAYT